MSNLKKFDPEKRYFGKLRTLANNAGFVKHEEIVDIFGRDIFVTPLHVTELGLI